MYTELLEKNWTDTQQFANIIGSLEQTFLGKLGISFYDIFKSNMKFKEPSGELASRLIALCQKISNETQNRIPILDKVTNSILFGN